MLKQPLQAGQERYFVGIFHATRGEDGTLFERNAAETVQKLKSLGAGPGDEIGVEFHPERLNAILAMPKRELSPYQKYLRELVMRLRHNRMVAVPLEGSAFNEAFYGLQGVLIKAQKAGVSNLSQWRVLFQMKQKESFRRLGWVEQLRGCLDALITI